MSILKKLVTQPIVAKYFLNHFAPFKGAGIQIEKFDLKHYHIRVKMPLTRQNRNIVGVHFGGSLYAMVDPFYMLLLMHHLGPKYIVWDKSSTIQFLAPGRGNECRGPGVGLRKTGRSKPEAHDRGATIPGGKERGVSAPRSAGASYRCAAFRRTSVPIALA